MYELVTLAYAWKLAPLDLIDYPDEVLITMMDVHNKFVEEANRGR